jgi:hypothetical protein
MQNHEDHAMIQPDRFLRLDEFLERTGLSRSSLYRKIDAGTSLAKFGLQSAASGGGKALSLNGCTIPCAGLPWHRMKVRG